MRYRGQVNHGFGPVECRGHLSQVANVGAAQFGARTDPQQPLQVAVDRDRGVPARAAAWAQTTSPTRPAPPVTAIFICMVLKFRAGVPASD